MKVVTPGNYTISLRRWPVEADLPDHRRTCPAGENVPGADRAFRALPGKAIPATSAILRTRRQGSGIQTRAAGDHEIVFTTRLAAGRTSPGTRFPR